MGEKYTHFLFYLVFMLYFIAWQSPNGNKTKDLCRENCGFLHPCDLYDARIWHVWRTHVWLGRANVWRIHATCVTHWALRHVAPFIWTTCVCNIHFTCAYLCNILGQSVAHMYVKHTCRMRGTYRGKIWRAYVYLPTFSSWASIWGRFYPGF